MTSYNVDDILKTSLFLENLLKGDPTISGGARMALIRLCL